MRLPKLGRWFAVTPRSLAPANRRRIRPRLEPLEDRTLPSTFTVMNLNDSGPGSLRAGLASGDDTITFAAGLHGTIKLTGGELPIASAVTINGPGASKLSVSGNNASRVFHITTAPSVTINGLTITQGYAPDEGGGILNEGANLTLSGVNLTQNVAYESSTTVPADELAATLPTGNPVAGPGGIGGGLQSLGGTLTVTGCQITGNQALGGGGPARFGEAAGGGIAILGGNKATITSSTFSGNLAHGGDNSADGRTGGGALMTWVPVNIKDCTISDNVAQGAGNMSGSAFSANGVASGGGMSFQPSSTNSTISGSIFSGNQAVGGNGGVGGGPGDAGGGAILNFATLSISASTFDHNQAIAGSGGSNLGSPGFNVDYAEGGAIVNTFAFEPGIIDITTSTFSHNQAVGGNNSISTSGSDLPFSGGGEGGALCNFLALKACCAGECLW